MVPHGDRSGVVIEPYLTDQWYVDAKTMAQPAIAAVRSGATDVRAEELGKDLFRVDGEHPALVHLAPALVGPPDSGLVRAGRQGVRRRDRRRSRRQRARLLRRAGSHHAGAGAGDGARPGQARRLHHSATKTCSTPGSPRRCGRSRRWAGPTTTRTSKRYYPTDVLVTGWDIIFFWVARMMMMGLHFMKDSAVLDGLHPSPRSRREGREDVEVERQRHRSPGRDRRLRRRRAALCAGARRRRRATTSSCRRNWSKPIAISRPSCGMPAASPR